MIGKLIEAKRGSKTYVGLCTAFSPEWVWLTHSDGVEIAYKRADYLFSEVN